MKMNRSGVVSVKVLIISSVIVSSAFLFLGAIISGIQSTMTLRDYKMKSESILSNYDTYLFSQYGLYGYVFNETYGEFSHSLIPNKHDALFPIGSLNNLDILESEIIDFMTLRMPINYIDQLLTKLEVIDEADKTNGVLSAKTLIDTAVNELGVLLEKQNNYSKIINEFKDVDWPIVVKEVNHLNNEWLSFIQIYETSISMEKVLLESFKLAKETYDAYNSFVLLLEIPSEYQLLELKNKLDQKNDSEAIYRLHLDEIKTHKKHGQSIFNQKHLIYDKFTTVSKFLELLKVLLIDINTMANQVKIKINLCEDEVSQSGAIEEVCKVVLEALEESENLIDDVVKKIDRHQSLLDAITGNVEVMNGIKKLFDLAYDETFSRKLLVDLSDATLDEYYNKFPVVTENKKSNEEDEKYYDDYKGLKDESYESAITGNIIDFEISSNNDRASFWQVVKIKDHIQSMYESLMINEYILSTFTAYAQSSQSDFDYFDKYNRKKYFVQGEVEFILMGHKSEVKNVTQTMGLIFGVRTVMNGIHVYFDKDKLFLSETIGLSVAGWTGLGAPIVTNILRLGWAAGESIVDMNALRKGEGVPFLKISPDQWQLDLGIVIPKVTPHKISNLMTFNYHDYLRMMLITLKDRTKLDRIATIIEINAKVTEELSPLRNYHTGVKIENETQSLERSYVE